MVPHTHLGEVAHESLPGINAFAATNGEGLDDGFCNNGRLSGGTLKISVAITVLYGGFIACYERLRIHSRNFVEVLVVVNQIILSAQVSFLVEIVVCLKGGLCFNRFALVVHRDDGLLLVVLERNQ